MTSEKTAFLSSANRMVGNVYDYTNRWSRYWNLAALNDSLAKENARLKMRLPISQFSNLTDSTRVVDNLYQQQYKFTEASVINNTVNRKNNYLTLNRGSRHGIRLNSGVAGATGEGVVGIVISVSTHFSTVMSILHQDTRISCKIKRNGYFGVMTWNGKDISEMNLEAIPKHAKIMKGDTIITSGYSTIFPEGIIVGTIDSFYNEQGTNFYNISVDLNLDMNNLQYVNIVDDIMREERQEIEKKLK